MPSLLGTAQLQRLNCSTNKSKRRAVRQNKKKEITSYDATREVEKYLKAGEARKRELPRYLHHQAREALDARDIAVAVIAGSRLLLAIL
jgi:hypothetical protein